MLHRWIGVTLGLTLLSNIQHLSSASKLAFGESCKPPRASQIQHFYDTLVLTRANKVKTAKPVQTRSHSSPKEELIGKVNLENSKEAQNYWLTDESLQRFSSSFSNGSSNYQREQHTGSPPTQLSPDDDEIPPPPPKLKERDGELLLVAHAKSGEIGKEASLVPGNNNHNHHLRRLSTYTQFYPLKEKSSLRDFATNASALENRLGDAAGLLSEGKSWSFWQVGKVAEGGGSGVHLMRRKKRSSSILDAAGTLFAQPHDTTASPPLNPCHSTGSCMKNLMKREHSSETGDRRRSSALKTATWRRFPPAKHLGEKEEGTRVNQKLGKNDDSSSSSQRVDNNKWLVKDKEGVEETTSLMTKTTGEHNEDGGDDKGRVEMWNGAPVPVAYKQTGGTGGEDHKTVTSSVNFIGRRMHGQGVGNGNRGTPHNRGGVDLELGVGANHAGGEEPKTSKELLSLGKTAIGVGNGEDLVLKNDYSISSNNSSQVETAPFSRRHHHHLNYTLFTSLSSAAAGDHDDGQTESYNEQSRIQLAKVVKNGDSGESVIKLAQSEDHRRHHHHNHLLLASHTPYSLKVVGNVGQHEKFNSLLRQSSVKPRYESGTSGADDDDVNPDDESAELESSQMKEKDSWGKLGAHKPSYDAAETMALPENRLLSKSPWNGGNDGERRSDINQNGMLGGKEKEEEEETGDGGGKLYFLGGKQGRKVWLESGRNKKEERNKSNSQMWPANQTSGVGGTTGKKMELLVGLHSRQQSANYPGLSKSSRRIESSREAKNMLNIDSRVGKKTSSSAVDEPASSEMKADIEESSQRRGKQEDNGNKAAKGEEDGELTRVTAQGDNKPAGSPANSEFTQGSSTVNKEGRRGGEEIIMRAGVNDGEDEEMTLDKGDVGQSTSYTSSVNSRLRRSVSPHADPQKDFRLRQAERDASSGKRSEMRYTIGAQHWKHHQDHFPTSDELQFPVKLIINSDEQDVVDGRVVVPFSESSDPPLLTSDGSEGAASAVVTSTASPIMTTVIPEGGRGGEGEEVTAATAIVSVTLNLALSPKPTGGSGGGGGGGDEGAGTSSSPLFTQSVDGPAGPDMNIDGTSKQPPAPSPSESVSEATTTRSTAAANDIPTSESNLMTTTPVAMAKATTLSEELGSSIPPVTSTTAVSKMESDESVTTTTALPGERPPSTISDEAQADMMRSTKSVVDQTEIVSTTASSAGAGEVTPEPLEKIQPTIVSSSLAPSPISPVEQISSSERSPPLSQSDEPQGTTLNPPLPSGNPDEMTKLLATTNSPTASIPPNIKDNEETPADGTSNSPPVPPSANPEDGGSSSSSSSAPECDESVGLECSGQMEKCVCKLGMMYDQSEGKCKAVIGSECLAESDGEKSAGGCPPNAVCKLAGDQKGVCECAPGFRPAEDKTLCLAGWNGNCSPAGSGTTTTRSRNSCHPDYDCSSGGKCVCKANQSVGLPAAAEGMNTSLMMMMNDGVRGELKCFLDYGANCDPAEDHCNGVRYLKCSKPSRKCECVDNSSQVYDGIRRECVARVGSPCMMMNDSKKMMGDKWLACVGNSTCVKFGNETDQSAGAGTCKCLDMYDSHWQGYCVLKSGAVGGYKAELGVMSIMNLIFVSIYYLYLCK